MFPETTRVARSSECRQIMQKILTKQADRDKIFKIIQRKVLKGTHLPVIVKKI